MNSCLRFVTVCENDLFVTETEEKFAEDFITEIALKFDMSDLEENGMENYIMIHTLMEYGLKLSRSEIEKDNNATRYMRNVGYLMTRPELSFCVRMIRRDMQIFEEFRETAMKICATAEIPIVGDIVRGHRIDSDDGKSVAEHIFHDGESSIMWGSSKQETVVLLSCEAEDMAWTEAMEQVIWLQELHRHTIESE